MQLVSFDPDMDREIHVIAKNEHMLECVSCKDLIDSQKEEYETIHTDNYCLQCLDDGGLLAYRYG